MNKISFFVLAFFFNVDIIGDTVKGRFYLGVKQTGKKPIRSKKKQLSD